MRPYIICHMVTSIDGKVTGEFLSRPECAGACDVYYEINRDYKADAFACGRITMEGSFTGGFEPDLSAYANADVPEGDYVAESHAGFFAVAFDRHGRLGWTASRIVDDDPGYGDAHIIEVVLEDAPREYLAYLRDVGVSYVFAGNGEMDLPQALDKLRELFGIRRLLLEGGSVINGAFIREGVVDELSLVVAPLIGGAGDKPLFDGSTVVDFELKETKVCDGGVVWMNYGRI